MGGVAFLLAAVLAWLLTSRDLMTDLPVVLLVLATGALGLLDDALALQRKRAKALGLRRARACWPATGCWGKAP